MDDTDRRQLNLFYILMPKNGICPVDEGKICINHATFNANLNAMHVYCISAQESDSNNEDTMVDINNIHCVMSEVGV
jgi:hypothetical protein